MQPTKSKGMLIGGTEEDRVRFAEMAAAAGIGVVKEGGIVMGGFPVGSRDFRQGWAEELATKVIDQQARIATAALNNPEYMDFPRSQAVVATIRLTGSSSFTWAARGVAPDILEPAAQRVDKELFRIVLGVLNLRERFNRLGAVEQAFAETRFNLSAKTGGLACGGCVAALRGGYLGGVIDLARSLKAYFNTFVLSDLVRGADAVFQAVRGEGGPDSRLTEYDSIDALADGRRSGKAIQHDATATFNARTVNALIATWGRESNRTACLVGSQGKAHAAIRAGARLIETRLNDAEMRTAYGLMLCLPQTDYGPNKPCPCGAEAQSNPQEAWHAFLCESNTQLQQAATDSAAALFVVVQTLPRVRPSGRRYINKMNHRPDEPLFEHARQHVDAKLVAPADAARRFDMAYVTSGGAWHYIDFKKVATINASNIKEACHKQGAAVEAGDKGKSTSYRKSISNLDTLAGQHIHFAVTDYCGALSKGYDKLLKSIAMQAYPGDGLRVGSDVDGLRSMCVARLRTAVGVGIWRANHKTISAWANKAYPDPHGGEDIDKIHINNNG